MDVGEKIKAARKRKGFRQRELGEIVNVTHSAISQIENGKVQPNRRTLILLAQALETNFDMDWLDQHLEGGPPVVSKQEIVENMSAREFLSLKFGGRQSRRSKHEAEMLAQLLDAEIERMERGG